MPFAFFALAARASLSARRKAQLIHRPSDEQLLKILSEDFGALPDVVLQNEEMLKVIPIEMANSGFSTFGSDIRLSTITTVNGCSIVTFK